MGNLCTNENPETERDLKTDKDISDHLDGDKVKDDEILKLLLLGAGESGKSTLFKQIIHIHGRGFDEKARLPYKSIVYTNTILSMKTLIRESGK